MKYLDKEKELQGQISDMKDQIKELTNKSKVSNKELQDQLAKKEGDIKDLEKKLDEQKDNNLKKIKAMKTQ